MADLPLKTLELDEQLEAVQIPKQEYLLLQKLKKQGANSKGLLQREKDSFRDLSAASIPGQLKPHELDTLDSYIIEKCIGKGGFSKVFQVRKKLSGQMYAMKILRKDKIKLDNKVEQIMTERRILERVNHPFIIKMHSAFVSVRNNIL